MSKKVEQKKQEVKPLQPVKKVHAPNGNGLVEHLYGGVEEMIPERNRAKIAAVKASIDADKDGVPAGKDADDHNPEVQ